MLIAPWMVVASLWVLGGGPMAAPAGNPAPGVPLSGVVTGAHLVQVLARGVPVEAHGLQVTGDVNLTSLTEITAALRCSGCTLHGALNADDVEFHSVLDLNGSRILGGIQARGARFDRGMVLTRGHFAGPVSFEQAVFEEQAALGAAEFGDVTSFAGARFQGESIFAGARFAQLADFSGAVFAGDADFSGQALPGAAGPHHCPAARPGPVAAVSFAGAIFHGRADFYNRCFTADADFFGTVLGGAANFDSAEFIGDAVFENASFGSDATFVLTWFDAAADFASVLADRGLSFDFDNFGGVAALDGAVVRGRLSLMNLIRAPYCKLPRPRPIAVGCLSMDNVTAVGIVMDPGKVGALVLGPFTQLRVLTEIEQTARADGDVTTANDARYDRLILAARARSGVWAKVQDGFFYRAVAGYLVRPWQPLMFLGILVAAGFLLRCLLRPPVPARVRERVKRFVRARRAAAPTGESGPAPEPPAQAPAPAGSGNPGHGQPSRSQQAAADPRPQHAAVPTATEEKAELAETAMRRSWLVRPFEALRDTVVAALKPLPSKEARKAARRPQRACDVARSLAYTAEYLSYKLLTLLFLTCIANSNQTLHQFIDAAFGMK